MANLDARLEPEVNRWRKLAVPALLLLLLAGAAVWLVANLGDDRVGVRRPPEPNTQIDLVPPPPPPPPPPPQELPPEPVETPTPDPTPAPAAEPSPEAPAPMSIDAPATAGADSFGLQSGAGGGMGSPGSVGTCVGPNCGRGSGGGGAGFNDSFYRSYLTQALQAALRRDKSVNRDRFTVTALIWIDGSGRVSRADIANGSGDAQLDQRVIAALRNIAALRPPQEGVRFPQRTVVRGSARGT